MKTTKKLLSILMAVLVIAALSIPAFAADKTETVTYTGADAVAANSFKITKANPGEEYKLYKVFDATYNASAVAYTYTCSSATDAFLVALQAATTLFKVTLQTGTTYTYNIEKVSTATDAAITDFLTTNVSNLTVLLSKTLPEGKDTLVFDKIPCGYYYATTTTGSAVSVDTANPTATVTDKNETPTLDKKAKSGSDTSYSDSNTASIGDTVSYEVVVTVGAGAVNYKVEDTLTGFRDLSDCTVEYTKSGESTSTTLTKGTQYTLSKTTSPLSFTLTFDNTYLATLGTGDKFTITYSAVVADTASIGSGNSNDAKLYYGNKNGSTGDSVTTSVYSFDMNKTDDSTTPVALSGVVFNLYTTSAHTDAALKFAKSGDTYKLATSGTTSADITTNGNTLTIAGLDAGTYYLYEKSTLDGYNKLTEDIIVTIAEDGTVTYSYKGTPGSGTLEIVNTKGVELPETGGVGTTLFIVFGTVAVLVAGVFLVTNKRMRKEF